MIRPPLRSLSLGLALSLSACGAHPTPTSAQPEANLSHPGPGPDPHYLEQMAATARHRLGRPSEIHFSAQDADLIFLQSPAREATRSLYRVDPQTGEITWQLDAQKLLASGDETLSPEERARRERLRLFARGIARYQLAADSRHALIPLSSRLFVLDLQTQEALALPDDGAAEDATLSPNGQLVALTRQGDLYVQPTNGGPSLRLSHEAGPHTDFGLAEFVAQEEMDRMKGLWWAPDSQAVLYQRTDTAQVESLYISDPQDQTQPAQASPYPRPGKENAEVRLFVQPLPEQDRWDSAALSAPVEIRWDRARYPYVAQLVWPKSGPPTVLVQRRDQQEQLLLAIDPHSGETRPLLTESDPAWLNIDPQMPRWIDAERGFLWTSERSGQWQLELRRPDGALERTLTPPDFAYAGLARLDTARNSVWVHGAEAVIERSLWDLSLDGQRGPHKLSTPEGLVHIAATSDGAAVLQSDPVQGPSQWQLHRVETDGDQHTILGAPVAELPSLAEPPPFEVAPRWIEVALDGRTHYTQITLPRGHQAGWRYPVILSVYGGPLAQTVRRNAQAYAFDQWLADHGFAIVRTDGRGTPHRGRAWERAIHRDFATVPLEDQSAVLRALGAQEPALDLERVGVFGWSFGGYFSALAVLRKPELFSAAVAGAPVTDWLDYDTHYTERYLGVPVEGQPDSLQPYTQSSLLADAPKLTRPLLLIHGTADDNVWFSHSLKLSDALLMADRDHAFLPLLGQTHMVAEAEISRRLYARITGFFVDLLGTPQFSPPED